MVVQARERLLRLLSELFQFDRAELDFGIYSIMNAKRDEILRFLDHDLLPEVGKALGTYENTERASLEAELEAKIRLFREAALDEGMIDNIPAIRALREKLGALANPEDLESEIFDALFTFFSRYYKDGDFLSLRRYKPGVYAIPYEGEEVKLHWANADQYYVKSTEDFQDYRFQLREGRAVHFRLVAAQTDRDNNKPAGGQERRFVLRAEDSIEPAGNDLNIYFEYRACTERQAKLNEETVRRIMQDPDILAWLPLLCAPAPTPSNKDRTLLEKHLADYTAKNSFDYFIHKDLGGFLRRELDFYLKNEILRIDELDTADNGRATHTLARLRAIKQVADKLIDFLAQLEDFQKKLWLKKKFVVRADYCITLDLVPEQLYPEIMANDGQREEWVLLFAIDEIKSDLTRAGYSAPLTVNFLRGNPYLVVDTRHFLPCFKDALMQSIQDLDAATSGLMVRSENFQALRLIESRYEDQVKCIYIDPPYNTGGDDFLYKDNYQHSSWLSLIADRIVLGKRLLSEDGVFFSSIDDLEIHNLRILLNQIFGPENFVDTVIWKKRYGGGAKERFLVSLHEYVLFFCSNVAALPNIFVPLDPSSIDRYYKLRDEKFAVRGPYRTHPLEATKSVEPRANLVFPIPGPGGVEIRPERQWWWDRQRVANALEKNELEFIKSDKGWTVHTKQYLRDEQGVQRQTKAFSIIDDIYTQHGTAEITSLFGDSKAFAFPKPVGLVKQLLQIGGTSGGIVLDYFAGSGTTAHAVVSLNREDGGKRKYVLMEMGDHFDAVLKPRTKKVIYSKDWKGGKPVSREGSSHMFKYMTLESYEDTLNNLRLRRPRTLELALEASPAAHEDYLLHYMLDFDTRGSASLLDVDRFDDPFHYQLLITHGGESQPTIVDLVETFNWLLGLRVHKLRTADGYRTVEGTDPDGRRVLVVWRVLKDGLHTNEDLDRFFREQGYADRPAETALDRVYVNGDCTLAGLRRPHDRWNVRLTEAEFGRLMFSESDGAL